MKSDCIKLLFVLSLIFTLLLRCPENEEDVIMFHIYHSLNDEITLAVKGTDIDPAYLAALISLESHPPGNRKSQRFEQNIYDRLLELKNDGKNFGRIPRKTVMEKSDKELRDLATSFGLTQIMGFHCLDLGCNPEDLKGMYHLQWAAAWMQKNYGKKARERNWSSCFRIHNTGKSQGETHRRDYVERGLARMAYYKKWAEKKGNLF